MTRRLRYTVHGIDANGQPFAYGPADVVPDWAQAMITNPDIWIDDTPAPGSSVAEESSAPAGDITSPAGGGAPERPPAAGPGSGLDAWRAYAAAIGVEHDEHATRADIIAAVEAHQPD